MNYYPHHIGDFDRATRHLTRLERSIYRDLLELYYDTEEPLTLDRAALCRKILARTEEEATAVEQMLNEFFTKTEQGWYHERCEAEIEKYKLNNGQKSKAGKASAEKRAAKKQEAINARSTAVETPVQQTNNGSATNQEPVTNNQEPNKKTRAPSFDGLAYLVGLGVDEKVGRDWLAHRKTKKAAATETAIAGIAREADKAGVPLGVALEACCARGWVESRMDGERKADPGRLPILTRPKSRRRSRIPRHDRRTCRRRPNPRRRVPCPACPPRGLKSCSPV
jgi:uncharacterized protein YdaU (DUF1376 family)